MLQTVWGLPVEFLADLSVTWRHCETFLQFGAWWRLTSGFLSQQAFFFVSTGVQAHCFGDHLAPVLFYTREHHCYIGHVYLRVTGVHSKAFVPGSEWRDCAVVTGSWLLRFSSARGSWADSTSADTLDSNNAICGHKAQPWESLARLMQVLGLFFSLLCSPSSPVAVCTTCLFHLQSFSAPPPSSQSLSLWGENTEMWNPISFRLVNWS